MDDFCDERDALKAKVAELQALVDCAIEVISGCAALSWSSPECSEAAYEREKRAAKVIADARELAEKDGRSELAD